MDKSFPAKIDHLPKMLIWIRSLLEEIWLTEKEKKKLELALEEAIVNVITHSKPREIRIQVRHIPGEQVEFDLADEGPPFNPLAHPINEQDFPREQLKPGGKGLILMRKCTDALLYRREQNVNHLTLIKKIDHEKG